MFGFMKSPIKIKKQNSVDPGFLSSSTSNPFESDGESDDKSSKTKQTIKPARRTASEPTLITPNFTTNPFDDDDNVGRGASSTSSSVGRKNYKDDFQNSGGLENQSVQELENYAAYKAEETTKTVNSCLKIAEDIREDATKTLEVLHQQGEQINRTHMMAADMDKDLSRGEKLLGNLGGMFSKTWKPKKGRDITGPLDAADSVGLTDNTSKRSDLKQREKLGIAPIPKGRSSSRTPPSEPTNALQKVEVEKAKQDDSLADLSNILGDLKNMAVDMGTEIERHNKALDHLGDDVDELNFRVKGANQRARRLLGK